MLVTLNLNLNNQNNMEVISQHLLEFDENPFAFDSQLNNLKRLLSASKLSQTPLVSLSYVSCKDRLDGTELISNIRKFKGVLDIEDRADFSLMIVFNNFLNAVNLIKFFTLANQVEFNPYTFDLSFVEAVEPVKVLSDRKDKTNLPKKQKKKPSSNASKFTARFYFFIESSPEFELSKKIIGKKGKNMKMILEECEKVFQDGRVPKDFLKLRLRGRGSSYKEGATNKESDEDLHLCLSAKNAAVLNKAVELIEKLLEGIFKEYNVFCKKQGIKAVKRLYRLISDLKNN